MKIQLTHFIFKILICLFCFFNTTTSFAELKPIAKEVKNKHDLNIHFYKYNLFFDTHEITNDNIKQTLSSGTTAQLIPGKLFSLVQQKSAAIILDIPFNGGIIPVELVSADIFTEDFSVVTSDNQKVIYTPGVYYRGTIKGNPNSLAVFSFFNNELYGIVSDEINGNIVVGRVDRPDNRNEYIIYSDRNLSRPPANFCSTIESQSQAMRLRGLNSTPSASTTKCVRLYYEVDHDIYLNNSSNVVNTTNWMTAVHNNVQTLYANDNISVALSQVFVWSTTDPYNGSGSGEQLDTFQVTRVSFNGDAGQLIGHDGGYGGLAYVDVLCTSFNYSYSDVNYSYNTVPTYSWTIEVITHEFGHVLGSAHTQSCSWPVGALDDCYATEGGCPQGPTPANGGTIMSYCHLSATGINFNNGFGPYPAGAIQTAVNTSACLGASCAVCPVPAHNACTSPATLNISANCVYVTGNLCGATESIPPINCNSRTAANGYDVWYQVTPNQSSMIINCQSGTSTDAVLGLYSGTCGSLTLLYCSDTTTTGGLETITAAVTAGVSYFIRVYDYNGNTTGKDFAICVTQNCVSVSNNSCSTPTVLNIGASCSFISSDLCSATQSMAPSNCSGYTSANGLDVWYTITPTQNNVRITCQSGIATDAVLGIYNGACGSLNLIVCNDSTGPGGIEILNATLTAGNTYRVRVYDWSGNQNGTDFQLCAEYPCSGLNPPTGATAASPTICTGSNTSLNVSGTLSPGATWHWYTSACGGTASGIGASINVTPSTTTTYYVRAENGSCYSVCSNVGVAVIPIPTAATSVILSPSAICIGDSSTITAIGSLSPGASWHWYSGTCGGSVAGTGSSSITVSPASATTYFVRAENGNCFSTCKNATLNVTAIPSAPVSANPSPPSFCSGASSQLSVTGTLSSGASWKWYADSCGGTNAGTGISLTVSPATNTTYYVRAENGNCKSVCVNTALSVLQLPNAPQPISSSSTSLCEGDTAILTQNGILSPGSNWYWYSDSCGGNSIGQDTTLSVVPVVTETYFVRAENATCKSTCESITITVHQLPAQPSVTVSNDTLSVPISSAYQWYWSSNGNTFSVSGNNQQLIAANDGYYFVVITDGNDCAAASDTILYLDPNSTEENNTEKFISVYPNPVGESMSIKIDPQIKGTIVLKIFDDTGRLVYNSILESGVSNSVSFKKFASGIYQLIFVTDSHRFIKKVVKR